MSSANRLQPPFDKATRQPFGDPDRFATVVTTGERPSEELSFSLRIKPDRRRLQVPIPPGAERRKRNPGL